MHTLETALIFNRADSCGCFCVNGRLCVSMGWPACVPQAFFSRSRPSWTQLDEEVVTAN